MDDEDQSGPECFVIIELGSGGSDERKRSDAIHQELVSPGAKAAGYTARRSLEIDESGSLTTQVLEHLLEAPMAIADMSRPNTNVGYELGIRHSFKLPCAVITDRTPLPFDVIDQKAVVFDLTQPSEFARYRKEIAAALEQAKSAASPVEQVLTVQKLAQGGALDRGVSQLLEMVTEVRAFVRQAPDQPAPVDLGIVESVLRFIDELVPLVAELDEPELRRTLRSLLVPAQELFVWSLRARNFLNGEARRPISMGMVGSTWGMKRKRLEPRN